MGNFKRRYRFKTNKALISISSTILICVLLLSVGFSSLSINTNISARAYMRVWKDIRVTAITITNTKM